MTEDDDLAEQFRREMLALDHDTEETGAGRYKKARKILDVKTKLL